MQSYNRLIGCWMFGGCKQFLCERCAHSGISQQWEKSRSPVSSNPTNGHLFVNMECRRLGYSRWPRQDGLQPRAFHFHIQEFQHRCMRTLCRHDCKVFFVVGWACLRFAGCKAEVETEMGRREIHDLWLLQRFSQVCHASSRMCLKWRLLTSNLGSINQFWPLYEIIHSSQRLGWWMEISESFLVGDSFIL